MNQTGGVGSTTPLQASMIARVASTTGTTPASTRSLCQTAAGDVFEHEIKRVALLDDFVDGDDVGVDDLAGGTGLGKKSRLRRGIAPQVFG